MVDHDSVRGGQDEIGDLEWKAATPELFDISNIVGNLSSLDQIFININSEHYFSCFYIIRSITLAIGSNYFSGGIWIKSIISYQ